MEISGSRRSSPLKSPRLPPSASLLWRQSFARSASKKTRFALFLSSTFFVQDWKPLPVKKRGCRCTYPCGSKEQKAFGVACGCGTCSSKCRCDPKTCPKRGGGLDILTQAVDLSEAEEEVGMQSSRKGDAKKCQCTLDCRNGKCKCIVCSPKCRCTPALCKKRPKEVKEVKKEPKNEEEQPDKEEDEEPKKKKAKVAVKDEVKAPAAAAASFHEALEKFHAMQSVFNTLQNPTQEDYALRDKLTRACLKAFDA